MADPNNYIIGQANPQPFAAIGQGYALGQGIRQDQQAQQMQQMQMRQQMQMQSELYSLANNPNATGADYSQIITRHPQLAEPLTKSWAALNDAQQNAKVGFLSQVGTAIASGQPDVAADLLNSRADAIDGANSGQPSPQSQHLRDQANMVGSNPASALAMSRLQLAAIPAGQKALEAMDAYDANRRANNENPADVRLKNAQADSAVVKAGVDKATAPDAIAAAGLANDKTLQEVAASKLSGQISQLNTQISQANSETERGKLVLERDKLVQQQKQTQFEQGQTVQSSMDAATNALEQLHRVMNHPGLSGGTFGTSAVGTFTGKISSLLPGTDAADFNANLDALKSQLFLSNVKALTGMGALSDAEGKKIGDAVASLDTKQSEGSFRTAGKVIESALLRAQAKAAANPQASTTNSAFVLNSPKYGAVTEGMVTRLMKDHPGSTRAQIIDFLQQSNDSKYTSQGVAPPPDVTPPNPYPPQ